MEDLAWARTLPARAAREAIVCGLFAPLIGNYARVTTRGTEHVRDLQGPVVLVANHASHADTPILLRALPAHHRRRTAVAAAADYFFENNPLLAATVALAFSAVPLERKKGAGVETDVLQQLIDERWNLVIYAEGTRSRDGVVGKLHTGAAVLAAVHDLPIVPVHIGGTYDAMGHGKYWMHRLPGNVRRALTVTFGAPIRSTPGEDRFEVMEKVRLFLADHGAQTTQDPKLVARRKAAEKRQNKALA